MTYDYRKIKKWIDYEINEVKKMKYKKLGFTIIFMLLLMLPASFAAITKSIDRDYSHVEVTLLNQDPDPAKQGEYLDLRWKIQKIGNLKLSNLTFFLEADYPFSFDKSDSPQKGVGDWLGYSRDEEYYTLHYKLLVDEDALEDTYDMVLRWTEADSNVWREQEFSVFVGDLEVPSFVIGTLTTSPIKLFSDTDEVQLDVEVENIGDGNASNVIVELALSDGFKPSYSFSDRDNLGTILADSSEVATFYVDIDASLKSDIYEAVLTIRYKEDDDKDNIYKTLKLPLDLPLHDKPTYEVLSVKTTPEIIHPSDIVEMKITLKNIGGEEADSVSLRAFKESSQPFDFEEKSDFIGKLKPEEIGEAVLKFEVDKDATPKNYILDLEIRTVDDDEVLTEDKAIKISVDADESKSKASPIIGIIIIALLALIGFVIYKYLTKKR